ncbi:uncharacterized protein LOC144747814 [Ciona intestinalis]
MYRSNNCQIFGSAEESCCKYCQMENKKIATVNIETAQQQGSKTASINHTNEDHFSKIFGRNQGDLNEWQQLFMNHQLQNAGIAPNSRRYHPDIVRWAIEFYCRSPQPTDTFCKVTFYVYPVFGQFKDTGNKD